MLIHFAWMRGAIHWCSSNVYSMILRDNTSKRDNDDWQLIMKFSFPENCKCLELNNVYQIFQFLRKKKIQYYNIHKVSLENWQVETYQHWWNKQLEQGIPLNNQIAINWVMSQKMKPSYLIIRVLCCKRVWWPEVFQEFLHWSPVLQNRIYFISHYYGY